MRGLISLFAGLAALMLLAVSASRADDQVVAGLSQHNIPLNTDFTGSELFIWGGIRPDEGHEDDKLDVIVAVIGPTAPVKVRKKKRSLGIWHNGPAVEIDSAPSFFAIATSGDFREIVSHTDDLLFNISLNHFIELVDAPDWIDDRREYLQAVKRIRSEEGLYSVRPNTVEIVENTMFQTRVQLPANLTEGDYTARVFLVRDKEVQDVFTDTIEVRRAGIGRLIYSSAQEYPALYGLISIIVALVAGWLASAFFRTFFPT